MGKGGHPPAGTSWRASATGPALRTTQSHGILSERLPGPFPSVESMSPTPDLTPALASGDRDHLSHPQQQTHKYLHVANRPGPNDSKQLRPWVLHPLHPPGIPRSPPWQPQGINLKAARRTLVTQRKEHSHLPSAGGQCWPGPSAAATALSPPRSPPPETILARNFPKPLGKKVLARLGQTKGIRQSSEAERASLGAVCPPPRGGAGKAWRWGQLRAGSPAAHQPQLSPGKPGVGGGDRSFFERAWGEPTYTLAVWRGGHPPSLLGSRPG